MGEMNKISCRSCGKNWEYRTGCGIRHSTLKAAADVFEEVAAQQFSQYINENPFPVFYFSYMPAQCSHCKEIIEVPFLELEGKQYVNPCPLCGHKVEVIKDIANFNCPACSASDLEWNIIGHWD